MQANKVKILKQLLSLTLLLSVVVMLSSRCARVAMPLGGPYDTLPPRVVTLDPGYGATNFDGKRVTITFDEYFLLKNQQQEFYTSPQMDKMPNLTIRNKSLQVDMTSPLDSNTTYALNFGNTIADNNEGNLFSGFRYVFSTGGSIDSLVMSGYTVDAYTADTLGNVYVCFFDDATADSLMLVQPWDTAAKMVSMDSTMLDTLASENLVDTLTREELLAIDSMLYKVKANAISRSYSNGVFIAENLAPKDYRIYAFQDNNGNRSYDPGVDLVAFTDSIYNPAKMPEFTIWYDTIQRRLQAEPQTYFRLFKETFVNKRANLGSVTRPEQQRLYFTFTGAEPKIESIELDSIPADSIITEYLTVGKDTISLWLSMLPENMPDSVAGCLIYQKYDSVNMLQPDTVLFNLGWRDVDAKKKEKERERALKDGEEIKAEVLEMNVKTTAGVMHNPEDKIQMTFTMPLLSMDSAAIELLRHPFKGGGEPDRVGLYIEQDTADIKKWNLWADWKADEKYTLNIPQGAIRDISGIVNDSLVNEFTIDSPAKYSTFLLNINNADPDKEYIVQLLSKDNKVIKERTHVKGGQLKIEFIAPGEVGIRVLEDSNRNGVWDTGDLRSRRHPELVANYLDANDKRLMIAKLNWELEFDLDMAKLFAPVNMQDILKNIQRMEREAQLKRDEQRREKQEQQHDHSHNSFM